MQRAERFGHRLERISTAPAGTQGVVQCNGLGGTLSNLPLELQKRIVEHVVADRRDPASRNAVLNLRKTSKDALAMVKEVAKESAAEGPYATPQIFTAAATGHFPALFKAKRRKNDVPLEESLPSAWVQYQLGAGGKDDVFVEKLEDKDRLFPKSGVSSQQLDEREKLVQSGRLFDPKGKWSPEINDAWTLGAIHSGRGIRLLSPPTHENLWDLADRPTATGRELLQAVRAGYTPARDPRADFASNDPETRGVRLAPSSRRLAVFEQATAGSPREREDELHKAFK